MTTAATTKRAHLIGDLLVISGLVHYHLGGAGRQGAGAETERIQTSEPTGAILIQSPHLAVVGYFTLLTFRGGGGAPPSS